MAIPVDAGVFRIDRRKPRPAVQEIQDVVEPESGIGGIQGLVHPPDEFIVLVIIDGPAVRHGIVPAGAADRPLLPRDVTQPETPGLLPEERRRVLALEIQPGLAPGVFQDLDRHDLGVVAIRERGGVQVARVIAVSFREAREDRIDDRRIDEWAVGRHLGDHLRAKAARDLEVTVEEIGRVPPKDLDPCRPAHRDQPIVGGIGRRGHHDPHRGLHARHALDHAHDERRPGEVHQDLARQAGRAQPCLHDDE